ENKNHFLLKYLGVLGVHQVISTAEVHFILVGHTQVKFDKSFSK
ncbi:unnamed protein product, partial [Discosporangium mesarthrocarpum]